MNKNPVAKIYIIRNNKNDFVYIGATKNTLEKRLYNHYSAAVHYWYRKPGLFTLDLKKYGIESFSIECLEDIYDVNKIEDAENKWIEIYAGANCYNKRKSVYHTSIGAKAIRGEYVKREKKIYAGSEE